MKTSDKFIDFREDFVQNVTEFVFLVSDSKSQNYRFALNSKLCFNTMWTIFLSINLDHFE